MFKKIIEIWISCSKNGIKMPFFWDPESNKPSVTLMFFWITTFLSIISLILLHLSLVEYKATMMTLVFVLLAFIMYRLRKLDKVKIDLDDQSIELENDNNINDKTQEKDETNAK